MRKLLIIITFVFSLNISYADISMLNYSIEKSAKDSVITSTFSISNLGCGSDAAAMQKTIAQTKGIKTCVVNAQKGSAVVKYDANKISQEEIVKIIENCSLCHDKNTKPFKVSDVK